MTPTLTPDQAAKAVWAIDIKPLYNVTEIARRLGLAKGTVHNWVRVPQDHVDKMVELTGMPRHRLRPDLFPDPAERSPWDE